jgi:DNA-binding transcriptional LysR family regulator
MSRLVRNKAILRDLVYFDAAAREGSFTAAAAQLMTTPLSVRAAIVDLEAQFNVQLFDRTPHHVELTSLGRAFVPVARRLIEEYHCAVEEMEALASGERGHVRIASTQTVASRILAPALVEYSRLHRDVAITSINASVSEVEEHVLLGHVDIGFSLRLSENPRLAFRPIATDQPMLVCRRGHPLLESGDEPSWSEMSKYPFVELAWSPDPDQPLHLDAFWARMPKPAYVLSTVDLLPYVLEDTDNVSIVHSLSRAHPALSRLVFQSLKDPPPGRTVCIITRRGRRLPPAVQGFVDHLDARGR